MGSEDKVHAEPSDWLKVTVSQETVTIPAVALHAICNPLCHLLALFKSQSALEFYNESSDIPK